MSFKEEFKRVMKKRNNKQDDKPLNASQQDDKHQPVMIDKYFEMDDCVVAISVDIGFDDETFTDLFNLLHADTFFYNVKLADNCMNFQQITDDDLINAIIKGDRYFRVDGVYTKVPKYNINNYENVVKDVDIVKGMFTEIGVVLVSETFKYRTERIKDELEDIELSFVVRICVGRSSGMSNE